MTVLATFKTADGTALNVDGAGAGIPVIFQHGLCGDARQTAETFPPLPQFRRITVEARGHGRSEPGELSRLSIATFAEDIAAYIESRMAPPVVVGGTSMGAAISLRLAVKRPELVKGLVLARPAWFADAAPDNMKPNLEVGNLLKRLAPDEAKAAFLASQTGRQLADQAPDNLASLIGFFARQPLALTAALLAAISNDGPGVTEQEIAQLDLPTLILGHEQDTIHPLSHAKAFAASIPNARFVQITPKVEDRARYISDFQQAMGQFLKEINDNE